MRRLKFREYVEYRVGPKLNAAFDRIKNNSNVFSNDVAIYGVIETLANTVHNLAIAMDDKTEYIDVDD